MSGIIGGAGSKSGIIGQTEIDYETGEFTPHVNASSDYSPSGYTATASGSYTKIGNMVHCQGIIDCSDKGTQVGVLRLDGLPFTVYPANQSAASLTWLHGWLLDSGDMLSLWIYSTNFGYFLQGEGGGDTQPTTSHLDTSFDIAFQCTYTTSQ